MKRFLLFVVGGLILVAADGQKFSAKDFLFSSAFSQKKLENYLSKKKFVACGSRLQYDTLVNIYRLKGKNETDSVLRNVETYQAKNHFSFAFHTSLKDEFTESVKLLKEAGFYCGDDTSGNSLLFQRKNISVLANIIQDPETGTLYSFSFQHAELPLPENIQHAEDLLQFYSHEYLVSVFGEKNVRKDLYYFSENEISKCSVLFPHTNRQAVFIWGDEANLCRPTYLLIGGNLNTGSLVSYNGVVAENIWNSKEGVYSGMSLSSLIKLNGNDFKFYGKGSKFPYMVVPENTGALNFKKNRVVLGFLNPNGLPVLNNAKISTDEIVYDNPGIYVFMIMFQIAPNGDADFSNR